MDQVRLVNVPVPQEYEAASSWISRFALSQGINMPSALEFLGIPWSLWANLDCYVLGSLLDNIRTKCNFSSDALLVHERVMTSCREIDPTGDSLLLHRTKRRPLFNYCPACFKTMRTPHVPVHWRFLAWRWCPEHNCILEFGCRRCGSRQASLTNLTTTNSGKRGIHWFSRCQNCGHSLGSSEPCLLNESGTPIDWPIQHLVLDQGRAFVSSLFNGYYTINGTVRKEISGIRSDIGLKAFESPIELLNPDWFRSVSKYRSASDHESLKG